MIHKFLFLFAFFLLSTSQAQDFCVADLKSAQTPSGYPCKSPKTLTVDDFVFSNLRAGNTSANPFKISLTPAFVDEFPAVNGLRLSAARLDMDVGGVVPMHSHSNTNELLIVLSGHITAGFISSDNTVFVTTLSKGKVMVFPQGLLHFQINAGGGKASAFLSFNSENPGAQILDLALFSNNLDSSFVGKTTLLDIAQIKKLKRIFGGRG
ncbi:hypothetical protein RJT34_17330 [Clitoria ternatea]|uniref:Germin-like protein n=1 Tax=Clitoria ternatea TaxID=43366 RepID=A0AAN9PDP9_CLITE